MKLLWPILEDSSTRNPTSALSFPQTAEGREEFRKLRDPKAESRGFVRPEPQNKPQTSRDAKFWVSSSTFPPQGSAEASMAFMGFGPSLALSNLITQGIKTSFSSWDQRRSWPLEALMISTSSSSSSSLFPHSLGPGRAVSGADTALVHTGASGSFVLVGTGRGVVPTLLEDPDGDFLVSNGVGATGAVGGSP